MLELFCQTSVLSLKTWSWLCFTTVTRRRRTTTTPHQISQLLLTRFWPNFKHRFLGSSRTDFNCHRDICPGNICPGNICPYQEYLSCYWLHSDQALKVGSWDNLYQIPTVMGTFVKATDVLATFVHISNISAVTDPTLTQIFGPPFFGGL